MDFSFTPREKNTLESCDYCVRVCVFVCVCKCVSVVCVSVVCVFLANYELTGITCSELCTLWEKQKCEGGISLIIINGADEAPGDNAEYYKGWREASTRGSGCIGEAVDTSATQTGVQPIAAM